MHLLARLTRWLPLAAAGVAWAMATGEARGQASNSISIPLANQQIEGENVLYVANDTFQIAPAPAYIYSITGNVHGVGPLFSQLVPESEPVATALETIDKGLSAYLQGSVSNPGGKLPATLLNQAVTSGTDGVFNANFGLSIDPSGLVSFSITQVVINEDGQPDTSDALFFDSGSITVTALSADVSVTTLGAASVTSGSATLRSSVISPNPFHAYFLYGTGSSLSGTSTMVSLASTGAAQTVAIPVTGLLPHQLYYFRAAAADITGPAYGTLQTFKTADIPPISGTFSAFAGLAPVTLPVLAHCIDPNNDALKVIAVTAGYGGEGGIAKGGQAATFRFTSKMPTDKFYFTVADDYGGSSVGLVNLVNYAALAGNYSAVLLDGASRQAGYLRVTLSATGLCTGSVIFNGVSYTFSGTLNSSGQLVKTISTDSPKGLSVTLDMLQSGSGYALAASVTQNTVTLTALLPPVAPGLAAGAYTIAFPPPAGASWLGSGYALLIVSPSGAATVTGALPDGAPFACSTAIDSGSQAAVYGLLYLPSNPGSIAGALAIGSGAQVTGTLVWTKPAFASDGINPGPFTITLTGSGGSYVQMHPTLNFNTPFNYGHLTLTGGNLNSAIVEAVTVNALNAASIVGAAQYHLSLTLQPAAGLFSGKFIDPVTGQPRSIHGVVLQGSGTAAGYFLGDSLSGAVSLAP